MSIRRYLVLTLFSILTLVTFVAAIQGYKGSMKRASVQFDQQLTILAETLLMIDIATESTKVSDTSILNDSSRITSSISPIETPIKEKNSIAFQVWQHNQLVLKTDNSPDEPMSGLKAKYKPLSNTKLLNTKLSNTRLANKKMLANKEHHHEQQLHFVSGFAEDNFLGQRWRTYTLYSKKQHKWVIVAQHLDKRFILAQDVILSAVTPMIVAITLLSILIYWVITQGLKPLRLLTKELDHKKVNDLSPLSLTSSHNELEPVIATLNQLFSRLGSAFERERRFASDAAHELRTPLSVLKINVHNVQRELNTNVESMTHLVESVDRMTHVIDQILNLNRTSPEQMALTSETLNFNHLIQSVISQYYNEIAQRQQSIELKSEDVDLVCNEFAIQLLVQNLLTNASKYTPNEGAIIISTLYNRQHKLCLLVEDSGPGIDEDEYQRVFDRFYRVGGDQHKSKVIGCGLGLAIVKHIAQLHGATIELSRSVTLKGLSICVIFPKNNSNKVIVVK